ncbi:MAG TPA: VTT domain-containing protein, partial [Phycisphaerae bacterium]|nr:VTT domain-containing protein [Phycisphaerae bacterium]
MLAPEFAEVRLTADRQLNFRAWFYPFILLLAGVAVASGPWTGIDRRWTFLVMLLGYMSLACTFFPLPTTPVVVLAASPQALGLNPWLLAAACTAGTCIANMHDYYLVTFFYRFRPVQRIRKSALYVRAARWFDRAPFVTLAAASFLPIPIDFVRLLAISQGYPRRKFVLASALGRWPRYFLLAYFTDRFDLGWQWVLAVAAVTVLVGAWRGLPRVVRVLANL